MSHVGTPGRLADGVFPLDRGGTMFVVGILLGAGATLAAWTVLVAVREYFVQKRVKAILASPAPIPVLPAPSLEFGRTGGAAVETDPDRLLELLDHLGVELSAGDRERARKGLEDLLRGKVRGPVRFKMPIAVALATRPPDPDDGPPGRPTAPRVDQPDRGAA